MVVAFSCTAQPHASLICPLEVQGNAVQGTASRHGEARRREHWSAGKQSGLRNLLGMTSSSRPGARVILRVGNLLTRQEVLESSGGSSPDLLEKPGDTPGQDENSASEYWGNIDLGDTGAVRGSARSLAGCVTWDESFSLDVQSGPQVAIWLCDMGRGGNRSCTMRSLSKHKMTCTAVHVGVLPRPGCCTVTAVTECATVLACSVFTRRDAMTGLSLLSSVSSSSLAHRIAKHFQLLAPQRGRDCHGCCSPSAARSPQGTGQACTQLPSETECARGPDFAQ